MMGLYGQTLINSDRKYHQKENEAAGQIDIYPTLLALMGCDNYYWKGLGKSIFSDNPPVFAVDEYGNLFGDASKATEAEIAHSKGAWSISDLMIRKKYFERKLKK
jgi:phosphoglycerol transferase MdoB-like AlkP superfamily enzyme